MISYVKAHWRGELSLGRSFWLNWVALYLTSMLAMVAGGQVITSRLYDYPCLVLLVLVFVWGAVGILRAAWHLLHSPATPVRKALAVAAIVIVVLAVVLTGGDFAILLRVLTR